MGLIGRFKVHGSGENTTLVNSTEELNDIMKFIKALEDSNILLKVISKTIKSDIKNKMVMV